jgi:hypothetical protein
MRLFLEIPKEVAQNNELTYAILDALPQTNATNMPQSVARKVSFVSAWRVAVRLAFNSDGCSFAACLASESG